MVSPELFNKISSGSHDGAGRHCDFYKMSATRGLKVYQNDWMRNQSYYAQLLCWMFGLAPEVFELFTLPTKDGSVYCYVTEILVTAEETGITNGQFWETHSRDLIKEYATIQAAVNDNCAFNCGMLHDKWVMIDFGDVTFGQWCDRLENEADLERWYNKMTAK